MRNSILAQVLIPSDYFISELVKNDHYDFPKIPLCKGLGAKLHLKAKFYAKILSKFCSKLFFQRGNPKFLKNLRLAAQSKCVLLKSWTVKRISILYGMNFSKNPGLASLFHPKLKFRFEVFITWCRPISIWALLLKSIGFHVMVKRIYDLQCV